MSYLFDSFKYASLLSVPMLGLGIMALAHNSRNFIPHRHTLSKTILLLKNTRHIALFKALFFGKAVLDFCFLFYVGQYFKLSWYDPAMFTMFFAIASFGTLGYFVEGDYSKVHTPIAYLSGTLWAVCQFFLAQLTGDPAFILFTNIFTTVGLCISYMFYFLRRLNIYVQILCFSFPYIWMLVFTLKYL